MTLKEISRGGGETTQDPGGKQEPATGALCELLVAACIAKCFKRKACKAPVVGRLAKLGCVIYCAGLGIICVFGEPTKT
jgi:hypothetical protein